MSEQSLTGVHRILVVDDNEAIHDDFRKILCPANDEHEIAELESELFGAEQPAQQSAKQYKIDSAFQGEEGLHKVMESINDQQPFAMAFVDMRMPPGWDGVETIEQIWQLCPELEVVVCTAYSDYTWSEIVARLGYSDKLLILKKPFDSAEVCQLAAALTRKRELVDQAGLKNSELQALVDERTENLFAEIEQRQKLEGRLLQSQKLEAVGQLAAGIAHEINTPAQFVGDNIRFLQDSFSDLEDILHACLQLSRTPAEDISAEEAIQAIKTLSRAAEQADIEFIAEEIPGAGEQAADGIRRISEIVKAMKEFSHPGNTEKTSIDLNQAIRSTITIAKNEWKYVAHVETDFDDSLPNVACYPGELNQVILNIVVNAAHAIGDLREDDSADKGTIHISTKNLHANGVEIRIQDTGGGIPPEICDRIFEPFFTTKDVGKGTGQGLAIAHDVVTHKHCGTLDVESHLGVGTTFIIRIPHATVSASPDNEIHQPGSRIENGVSVDG